MVTEAKTLRGSLKEFGLVEILQMMGLGNMTGALHLHLPDRTGIIYFHEGALVTCSELTTEALTLGHVLQQLRMATAEGIRVVFGNLWAGTPHQYWLQSGAFDPLIIRWS